MKAGTLNRDELIQTLRLLPRDIAEAEADLLTIEARRRAVAAGLERQEAELLLSGVDGKNEATRRAQLLTLTDGQRALLLEIESQAAEAKRILHRRQNELSALKTIARLLAAATD